MKAFIVFWLRLPGGILRVYSAHPRFYFWLLIAAILFGWLMSFWNRL